LTILRNQIALGKAWREGRLEAENNSCAATPVQKHIARSAAMQPVLEMISRVGPSDANVLVLGENGTGKGLVARLLHGFQPRDPIVRRGQHGRVLGGLFE
jgi:DNA-binding NtrC family response regulator